MSEHDTFGHPNVVLTRSEDLQRRIIAANPVQAGIDIKDVYERTGRSYILTGHRLHSMLGEYLVAAVFTGTLNGEAAAMTEVVEQLEAVHTAKSPLVKYYERPV
jgi:hypothetical protein